MWLPDTSEEIEGSALSIPLARAFASYIEGDCAGFARLHACHRTAAGTIESISFELSIELPQRPIYDIRSLEVVTVCFLANNAAPPFIAVDREDFPDTPHQVLTHKGLPCALCVDDRPWEDVRGEYTASELMSRIAIWFTKACEGELHGEDQPFDPFFAYDGGYQVILLSDGEAALAAGNGLNIYTAETDSRCLIATERNTEAEDHGAAVLSVIHASVEPQKMTRMRWAPRNLAQLADLLSERGVDFIALLKSAAIEWATSPDINRERNWHLCVFVSLPQIHPVTGLIGATRPMAFLCPKSLGEVGVALGALAVNEARELTAARYALVIAPDLDAAELDKMPLYIAPVHVELDASRAAALAAHKESDTRHLVMIGAGSLGSSLAESLTREGLYDWTIIDDDLFLPHNIARHTLGREAMGRAKAPQLVDRMRALRPDIRAQAVVAKVLSGETKPEAEAAFNRADLILDASASVPVSRWLSDRAGDARRLCAFFTPDGQSSSLMAESSDRSTTLRDLEAAYLREILVNPSLKDHHRPGQYTRYTGACRTLTNTIPASSIAMLSGLIAGAFPEASSNPAASLRIWSKTPDGGVACVRVPTECVRTIIGDWALTVPTSLLRELVLKRNDALPSETGGPLVGVADYEAHHIGVVHALPHPADSVGTPMGFERGTRGMQRSIDEAKARSGGQVRYLGEWHSHPQGHSATPSNIDMQQLDQLSLALSIDGLPALSLIVGEGELGMMLREAVR